MPALIRPGEPGDYAQWRPLWDGYNAFYGRSGATALPRSVTHATWQRFFDPTEPMFLIVASVEDRLCGLAHYLFHRSTILLGSTCYLQDLFVAPDARALGVGRLLVEAVYSEAKKRGALRVYWQTQRGNVEARRLYDKVGDATDFMVYRKIFRP